MSTVRDDVAFALQLAEAADAQTLDRFGALDLRVETKPDLTPVTDADRSVEDLIREVAVFAERSDVAEEVTRLASHLDQFEAIVRTVDEAPGRKLEFLVQEMGRETNTIGSKAGDVAVSRHVVEIKAALEKVRELVQNVE